MQVKRTFDDKLKVVELAGTNKRRSWTASGLSRIVASFANQMKRLVAAASDQAFSICSYMFIYGICTDYGLGINNMHCIYIYILDCLNYRV